MPWNRGTWRMRRFPATTQLLERWDADRSLWLGWTRLANTGGGRLDCLVAACRWWLTAVYSIVRCLTVWCLPAGAVMSSPYRVIVMWTVLLIVETDLLNMDLYSTSSQNLWCAGCCGSGTLIIGALWIDVSRQYQDHTKCQDNEFQTDRGPSAKHTQPEPWYDEADSWQNADGDSVCIRLLCCV